MKTFDAIVIGSGQGGVPLAINFAKLGWRVALIEELRAEREAATKLAGEAAQEAEAAAWLEARRAAEAAGEPAAEAAGEG